MTSDSWVSLDNTERKTRELEAMNAVAGLSVRNAPLAEIEAEAVRQVERLLGADSVALCLAADDGKSLTLAAGTGMSDEARRKSGEIRFGLLWKVFQTGKALVENDLVSRTDARRDLMEKGVTVHSTIAAPLIARAATLGTLSACSYRPRTFLPEEAALLGTLGAQLAAVLENARLREEVFSQKDLSEILLASATAFGRAKSMEDLRESLLEALQHATAEERVFLLEFDAESDTGWIAAMSNVPAEAIEVLKKRRWGPGNPVFQRLRDTRAAVTLSAEEIKVLDREAWETTRPLGLVFVPLFRQQEFFGALGVNLTRDQAPSVRVMSLLEGVAALVAASMSNLELWGLSERRAVRFATLLRAAHQLAGEREPDRVLAVAVEAARELTGAAAAVILSETPEGLRVEASAGAPVPAPGTVLPLLPALQCAPSDAPREFEEFTAGGKLAREAGEVLRARSGAVLPLRVAERLLGILAILDPVPKLRTREEITSLQMLATDTAVCLENACLLEDLALTNEEMRSAQEQVVQSESLAAIGRLSASIAHEFRNPLAGISAAAQALLKVTFSDPSNVQLLQIIDRESKKLNRLIADFLQFARPRRPVARRVLVPSLVDAVLASLAREFGDRITVERKYAPDMPNANVDADLVREVLFQLFTNAAQAMPESGTLRIRGALGVLKGLPAVELTIEDTGPGIPSSVQPRIFEPFFTTRKHGTGLGLAICHQIVSTLGGTIVAQNGPDGGARFTLLLPGIRVGSTPPIVPA